MSQIIPFDFDSATANLPAHLKSSTNINAEALAFARTGGFGVMSIKGKVFTLGKGDEKTMVMNPKDPESPASSIEVVLVRVQKGISKIYYAKGYTEGADAVKPECSSSDGITPDASIANPVCASCAACPKAVYGSKIGDNGKKQKACSDSIRIAIAAPDNLDEPMLLRVPPASIKPLHEHIKFMAKKGVDYNKVVTKISFEVTSPTPLLIFKPVGFVDEATYAAAMEAYESDTVQSILGMSHFGEAVPAEEHAAEESFEQAAPVIEAAKAKAAPKIATKSKVVTEAEVVAAVAEAVEVKKASTVVLDMDSIDLGNLSFDD